MKDISLVRLFPKEPRVPFISLRLIAAVLSVLALIASIFLFSTRNLNYGIDFTGGTVLEIDTGTTPELDKIRPALNALGLGEVALQNIRPPQGSDVDHDYVRVTVPIQDETGERVNELSKAVINAINITEAGRLSVLSSTTNSDQSTRYIVQVTDLTLTAKEATALDLRNAEDIDVINFSETILKTSNLDSVQVSRANAPSGADASLDYAAWTLPFSEDGTAVVQQIALGLVKETLKGVAGEYTERSQGVVGSKVSGELRQKGILAIVLALSMVLIYIWFRFEWQFAVGAVVALFHDVLLTIGVFSLTQLEFNLSIIAAILTIVGYSLNDTVIVYDRIRENLRKYKKMPLPEVLNLSINDTLSRTIMTSMTTLLALVALYILGGEGLRGFSFAMIWGVFVGTYSSIFVASPLLLLLQLKRGAPVSD